MAIGLNMTNVTKQTLKPTNRAVYLSRGHGCPNFMTKEIYMRKPHFFGFLAAVILLTGLVLTACSDSSPGNDGLNEPRASTYYWESSDGIVEITFSSMSLEANALKAGPQSGDYYMIKLNDDLISSGQVMYPPSGSGLIFVPSDAASSPFSGTLGESGSLTVPAIPVDGGGTINMPSTNASTTKVLTAQGAAIQTFSPDYEEVTSYGFKIKSSTAAAVSSSSNSGQTAEYAVSKSNTAPIIGWQKGLVFTDLDANTKYYVWARSGAKVTAAKNYNPGTAVKAPNTVTTAVGGKAGAAIDGPYSPTFSAVTSNGTTTGFTASSATVLTAPVNTGQIPEYYAAIGNITSGDLPDAGWVKAASPTASPVFTGLKPQETYYVWVRAASVTGYEAGPAIKSTTSKITGNAESGADLEEWTPLFVYTAGGFTVFAAEPVEDDNPGEQVVEYAVSTNTTLPANNTNSVTNWKLASDTGIVEFTGLATGRQYYVWARTRATASGAYPAGEAIMIQSAEIMEAGAEVDNVKHATNNPWDFTIEKTIDSITLTVAEAPATRTETTQPIEYALKAAPATGTPTAPTTGWTVPVNNKLVFWPLDSGTTYHLWARTKEDSGHLTGTPAVLKLNSIDLYTVTTN